MKKIPFNDWSKGRIAQDMKQCTSRHMRYPDDDRVTWISPKLPWWFIKEFLYVPEGAETPEELQEVIEGIYKRYVQPEEEFYVHFGDFKE